MSTLTDVRRELATLPLNQTAGALVTTSVPDRPVSPDELRMLMTRHGLNDALVPSKHSEVDDFRVACRKIETKRGARTADGHLQHIAVNEVVTNQVECLYQITAQVRDEQQRVIDHPKAMRVIYDMGRPTSPIRFEPLDPAYAAALAPLEDVVRENFLALRGRLKGAKVREILRRSFHGLHATRWARNTSMWFVDVEHFAQLDGWRNVLADLYGGDAAFDVTKLPRTVEQLEQIADKVTSHVSEDATKLMADIATTLNAGEKITERQFNAIAASSRALAEDAAAMQASYGSEIQIVQETLRTVHAQVIAAWDRVEVK